MPTRLERQSDATNIAAFAGPYHAITTKVVALNTRNLGSERVT